MSAKQPQALELKGEGEVVSGGRASPLGEHPALLCFQATVCPWASDSITLSTVFLR